MGDHVRSHARVLLGPELALGPKALRTLVFV